MDSNPKHNPVFQGPPSSVHCLSCGAEFDPREPKCPYCGTMYEPGAEAGYMEHLGDIREDMEDLNDLALTETGAELKQAAKGTVRIIVIIVLIIAVVIGLSALFDYFRYSFLWLW